jgi:hypothetical protein
MKSLFNLLFRKNPSCTGLLCLLITTYFITPKDIRGPILEISGILLPVCSLYVFILGLYMLFFLPKIEEQNREKITWLLVIIIVVVLTAVVKFSY